MPDSTRFHLHPLLGTAAVAVILTCAVAVYVMLRPTVTSLVTAAPMGSSAPAVPASSLAPVSPVAVASGTGAAVPVPASVVMPASTPSGLAIPAPVHQAVATEVHPRPKVVHHRVAPAPRPVTPVAEDPSLYDHPPGYRSYEAPSYCPTCGTVMSIQAMEVSPPTTGLGGLGGAAAGGLVGNQFGRGRGRTAMTVLGALGGAMAGNAVEQGLNRRVVYRMVVGFEDGTRQTFTQDQPFPFGEGEGVRMVNGMLYRR